MKIPIIFSTDHNYVMQAGVTILSLIKNAKDSIYEIFVIINSDVTEEDRKILKKQVSCYPNHSIDFIEIGDAFKGCYEVRGISIASYSRLLIPWLFPNYDKIIYIDVDVIINIDLASAYNEDLTDYMIAAVPSVAARTIQSNKKYILNHHLDPNKYCNAGVLIINCEKQRKHNLNQKYLIEAKKKYEFQDQDIINIVCKDQIKYLSPKYNLTPYFYQLIVKNDPFVSDIYGPSNSIAKYLKGKDCIIHYAGLKPWNTFTFAWIEWWQTYRESLFYDEKFELKISEKIINPSYTWKRIASFIKHRIIKH